MEHLFRSSSFYLRRASWTSRRSTQLRI
ncbi:unnamed protein product [Oikopleura dioica]|uniref:Uncharacterized protein n=1 Tax=Oikopleura dioica TaxID=34765 RepID=E4X7V6_OIKDI|nr:unnamed protein product [Oikopleura dioica]